MKSIDISKILGATVMTPLQMNGVHFDKRHTVITPSLLYQLNGQGRAGTSVAGK